MAALDVAFSVAFGVTAVLRGVLAPGSTGGNLMFPAGTVFAAAGLITSIMWLVAWSRQRARQHQGGRER